MIVIVGLGNPGKQYENTKHNAGFLVIDRLAERHGISVSKLRHKALSGDGLIAGKKVKLVKPQTFMNLSGESVRDILHYYGIGAEGLIVVYDDIDIPVGILRIRKQGSAGTHNGMKNIIYLLENDQFARFRVGIGADRGRIPLRDYVLSGFAAEHLEPMREAIVRCADAIELALADGIDKAMQRYNG
ncbi:MAG: aminoacyl-tRNA hydrolase [Clostridiales Family XIII bacterium]|jgi:PTH1 family peptidyl-tRNA hydrolase|nr:aminoacyl-tRNA hydrolase [Clostridiales Family XIII bacterium]